MEILKQFQDQADESDSIKTEEGMDENTAGDANETSLNGQSRSNSAGS